MDMTLNEFERRTSTSWNEKYQRLTVDMTKNKYMGSYRLGSHSLLFQLSLLFKLVQNVSRSLDNFLSIK